MVPIKRIPYIWLLNALLIGASIYFCIQIYAVWTTERERVSIGNAANPGTSVAAVPPVRRPVPPSSYYAAIVQKNLFTRDRTSQGDLETAVRDGGPAEVTVSGLTLFGIVIEGDDKKALLLNGAERQQKKMTWVEIGDQIGRYEVKQIHSDRLLLTSGGALFTMRLADAANTRAPRGGQQLRPPFRPKEARQTPAVPSKSSPGRNVRSRFVPAN
jgi:hypothetical protein